MWHNARCATTACSDEVYWKRKRGENKQAYTAYQSVLPFIVFTLAHLEIFLHVERRLLKAMGLIAPPMYVMPSTLTPIPKPMRSG